MAEVAVAGALITLAGDATIPIILRHMTFAQRRSAQTNVLMAQKLVHKYQNLFEAHELRKIDETVEESVCSMSLSHSTSDLMIFV